MKAIWNNLTTLTADNTSEHILTITLNRPPVMNAINSVMMEELYQLWSSLNSQSQIRCVILTGSGEKAFCAGADLKERHQIDIDTWQKQHAVLQKAMLEMIKLPVPIIAAVNGVAFGGGLELALASDFIYASETAIFAQSETKLGIIPGAMGTQNLPRACGIRRAKELCFTARPFSAQEALEWGIVNKLCSPQTLMKCVLEVAETIANNAPIAVRQAKKALDASQRFDLESGYQFEVEAYKYALLTEDRKEGISAFNEKRKANFKDK